MRTKENLDILKKLFSQYQKILFLGFLIYVQCYSTTLVNQLISTRNQFDRATLTRYGCL